MPEFYRHKRSREQIVGRRNILKDKVSAPVIHKLFGYEVSSATYKKYMSQDFTVAFSYWSPAEIEGLLDNAEWVVNNPEHAKEAQKIKNRIIAEITGKDEKNMKTPRTAADFIDALNDIYTATRAAYTELNKKLVNAQSKMTKAEQDAMDPSKNHQLAEAQYFVAKGEFQIAEDESRRGYYEMIENYDKQVKELRTQFAAHLDEHYSASPDKLDLGTMQLLNSGICTPVELARLVDRHQGNPTMLRIVGEYARKLREDNRISMSNENQAICVNVANAGYTAKDGSRELAIFDSAVSAANYGLGKDYDHATRMHGHMNGWFEDFKQNMNNLPVIPEEMTPKTHEVD